MGKIKVLLLLALVALVVTGCGPSRRVTMLEGKVAELDNRMRGLEDSPGNVDDLETRVSALERGGRVTAHRPVTPQKRGSAPSMREIQRALKNAGYYRGKVDGVKGRLTRQAIIAFQRANKCNPDGRVINRYGGTGETWTALKPYLRGALK